MPASTYLAVWGVLKAAAALHGWCCWAFCRAAWPAEPLPSTSLCPCGALWPSPCPSASTDCPGRSQPAQLDGRRASRKGDIGFPPLRALPGGTPHFVLCLRGKRMGSLSSWRQEGCKNSWSERKAPVIVEQLSSKSLAVDKEPIRQKGIPFPGHMVLQSLYYSLMMHGTDNPGH